MRKNKFKIIGFFLITTSLAIFILLKQYNKPHLDIKKTEAGLIVNANEILNDYLQDEDKANKKYTDKIIQIKGTVSKISTTDGNAKVILKSKDFEESIICGFPPEENKNLLLLNKGDEIAIKGICTGYLLDVILIKCVIIK